MVPFLLSAYSVFSLIYVIPQVAQSLGVGVGPVSLAISLSFVGGAVGGVVIGAAADRWGRRLGLAASIILFGSATMLAGLVGSTWELYMLWFLVGFGVNSENGVSYAVVVEAWRSNQGLLGSAMQGLYPVGMLLDAVTSILIRNWRPYMIVVGAISLIASLACIYLIPETKGRMSSVNYGAVFSPRLRRVTWLGTALVASAFLFTVPFISLTPTYLLSHGFGGASYGAAVIGLSIGEAIAFASAGYVMDRLGPLTATLSLASLALASSLAFLVLNVAGAGAVVIVPIALGYASSSFFAYMGILMGRLYPPEVRATGTNFTFLLGRLAAGAGVALASLIYPGNLGIGLSVLMIASSLLALASAMPLLRGPSTGNP